MLSMAMKHAGFDEDRVIQLQSDYYARMVRLQDNDVSLYVIMGAVGS